MSGTGWTVRERRMRQRARYFGRDALEVQHITEADFRQPGNVHQLGLPPRRVDLLTELSGVTLMKPSRNACLWRSTRARFL